MEPLPNRTLDALTWATLHALAFALISVVIKLLTAEVPVLEQIFVRSLVGLAVVLPVLRGRIGGLSGGNWRLLLSRGIAGFIGMYCTFYTIGRLPLLIAMILTLLTPVFVMAIGAVTLKERIPPARIGYAGIVLGSVLLVVYPFGGGGPVLPAAGTAAFQAYALDIGIGLFGSLASAVAFVSMRAALRRSTVTEVVIVFMGCNLALSAAAGGAGFVLPGPEYLAGLAGLGALGLLSDLFKTRAYKHALAGIVSVLSLLSVAFAAILGWLLFAETVSTAQVYGIAGLIIGIALLTAPERGARRA